MIRAILFSLFFTILVSCNVKNPAYKVNDGRTQGTYYHIVYQQPDGIDLHDSIEQVLSEFDFSLSTYNPESLISAINQNLDSIKTDLYFEEMFEEALFVSQKSNGAFDITVAPLVNLWGFGFQNVSKDDFPDVTSVMPIIGYQKVKLINHKIIKENDAVMLDANAIAQGYSADVVAAFLESKSCVNYLVEIGGEIKCKGINPKGTNWQVGIDKPIEDPTNENSELQQVVSISGVGLATSGNYRKFYYKDGHKYSHTINPKTGFPVEHNLLSATVIAESGMRADAFATAFMVLGVEESLSLCNQIPNMECYLIFEESGENKVVYSPGFKKYLVEEKPQ